MPCIADCDTRQAKCTTGSYQMQMKDCEQMLASVLNVVYVVRASELADIKQIGAWMSGR
jgi:hypothetical protein